jgi:hypothetical protein
MKKNIYIFLFIAVIILLNACKKKPESKMIGLWQMIEYSNNENVPPELKEYYNNNVKEYIKSNSYYFKEDSVLYAIVKKDTAKGKWRVDKNLTTLEMFDDMQNAKKQADIVFLDDKIMKLRSKGGNIEVNITLEKVNK